MMSQWVTLPLGMGWYGLRLRCCGPLSEPRPVGFGSVETLVAVKPRGHGDKN